MIREKSGIGAPPTCPPRSAYRSPLAVLVIAVTTRAGRASPDLGLVRPSTTGSDEEGGGTEQGQGRRHNQQQESPAEGEASGPRIVLEAAEEDPARQRIGGHELTPERTDHLEQAHRLHRPSHHQADDGPRLRERKLSPPLIANENIGDLPLEVAAL